MPNENELQPAWVAERLKTITIELIEAHRSKNLHVLGLWAHKAGFGEHPPKRLFMKLLHVYHPDRLAQIVDSIAQCRKNADEAGIKAIQQMLSPTHDAGSVEKFTFEWELDPSDLGFGEDSWRDHHVDAKIRQEQRARRRAISILDALRREFFGNLDLDFTRHDLEELDGEVELPDMAIESLDGLQVCRMITGLNLSANRINDVQPLRFLRRLEWLDLSHNDLDEADYLESCTRLEELDLSYNFIDDISWLTSLPRLRIVNLTGNPLRRHEAHIKALTEGGTLVIL